MAIPSEKASAIDAMVMVEIIMIFMPGDAIRGIDLDQIGEQVS
jgi:hypothetical protein